jgi:glycosyltransferase involved in cell wall biosynthesis
MRIALMGTRGVPASYSGFETAVEQLGQRLVKRGHEVTVYCRTPHITYPGDSYLGMRLVKLPTIRNKYFDTLFHTFISCLHAWTQRYDVALMFIAGNSLVSWMPRLVGTPVALNVDGLDWKRAKWNRFAKGYIQVAERLSRWLPTCVITDARVVQDYYQDVYDMETVFIPYGSDIDRKEPGETLQRLGLTPRGYMLFVGRLVPENNAHHVLEAFRRLKDRRGLKLVIVGDAPYANEYIDDLKKRASSDPDVIMPGYVFGDGYRELASNAFASVVATEVGGTHPVLLEAMALGNCVVMNDIPTNLETAGNAAIRYAGKRGADDLARKLAQLVADPSKAEQYRQRASRRAAETYSWERVADQYEELCRRLGQRDLKEEANRTSRYRTASVGASPVAQ